MPEIEFIRPTWSAPNNVHAFVTTRRGGISQAPYDSLNLGQHVNDNKLDVETNRARLKQALDLPNEPVWLNQIHSTKITELLIAQPTKLSACDGSLTSTSNVICAVMTADCLPLFLTNQAGDKVAVIHVGWRGLAQGIIENSIKLFAESPQNVIAWAGPCISINHFEIGADVRNQLGGSETAYQRSDTYGKYYADMYQLAGERLIQLGIKNYSHSDQCTYENKELFFSHRRDQDTGRMASLIWFD